MEIPETVWADAKALVHGVGFSESTLFVTNLYEIAAKAIMAEREKCAQIADDQYDYHMTVDHDQRAAWAAQEISQAIRNPLHKQT